MQRERWGTFSVIDHRNIGALVPEILLYDRLVIPTPYDPYSRFDDSARWEAKGIQAFGSSHSIQYGFAESSQGRAINQSASRTETRLSAGSSTSFCLRILRKRYTCRSVP